MTKLLLLVALVVSAIFGQDWYPYSPDSVGNGGFSPQTACFTATVNGTDVTSVPTLKEGQSIDLVISRKPLTPRKGLSVEYTIERRLNPDEFRGFGQLVAPGSWEVILKSRKKSILAERFGQEDLKETLFLADKNGPLSLERGQYRLNFRMFSTVGIVDRGSPPCSGVPSFQFVVLPDTN